MKNPRTFDELAHMSAHELSVEFRTASLALMPTTPTDQAHALRVTLARIDAVRRQREARTP